jgi:hypothetical protein
MGGDCGVFSCAKANQFGLGEQRVGCGATRGRIFLRVRHVGCGRKKGRFALVYLSFVMDLWGFQR